MNYHTHTAMRSGFSMLTAIVMIVLMAIVAGFVMNLSGKAVQETTTQYRKEQAILLAKSYTELAIMTATARNCAPRQITGTALSTPAQTVRRGDGYFITTTTQYIGNNVNNAGVECVANTIAGALTTAGSMGNIVLIDVDVEYRDPESQDAIDDRNFIIRYRGITFHKRTLVRL